MHRQPKQHLQPLAPLGRLLDLLSACHLCGSTACVDWRRHYWRPPFPNWHVHSGGMFGIALLYCRCVYCTTERISIEITENEPTSTGVKTATPPRGEIQLQQEAQPRVGRTPAMESVRRGMAKDGGQPSKGHQIPKCDA